MGHILSTVWEYKNKHWFYDAQFYRHNCPFAKLTPAHSPVENGKGKDGGKIIINSEYRRCFPKTTNLIRYVSLLTTCHANTSASDDQFCRKIWTFMTRVQKINTTVSFYMQLSLVYRNALVIWVQPWSFTFIPEISESTSIVCWSVVHRMLFVFLYKCIQRLSFTSGQLYSISILYNCRDVNRAIYWYNATILRQIPIVELRNSCMRFTQNYLIIWLLNF